MGGGIHGPNVTCLALWHTTASVDYTR
jgi:hypothetical protein